MIHPRAAWGAAQLVMAGLWWLALPTIYGLMHVPECGERTQPALWGVVAALVHGLLGLRLFGPANGKIGKSTGIDPRIVGGLKVLALRYFSGVGLVFVGLLHFRSCATVFVIAWSGLYLILIVSEMIVFSRGVTRL